MKKLHQIITVILGILFLLGITYAAIYYYKNLRGIGPAIGKPGGDITTQIPENTGSLPPAVNNTNMPLTLPDGFSVSIFAKNLTGARVMAFDSLGNMWVTRTSAGAITLIEMKDGKAVNQYDVFKNLDNPHGLVIDDTMMYFAEEGKVSRVALYTEDSPHKLVDLPTEGGGHYTRSLGIGPDGRLYVSIGSSCNVCTESDERRAAIYSLNKDGSDFKQVAKGLRNSVFFTWSYVDGKMWATDMGRDSLGDNVPPEEINIIESGKDYGWPVCYGNNIHDTNFDKNTYIQNPCNGKVAPKVEMQAHSAPLGINFIPEEGWPESYWHNLIVAFHGSWNRSEPTGYKLVRIKLDDKGNYQGTEDFITGWLKNGNALGRPVDVKIQPGGIMYVSDDKAGVIYKISYVGDKLTSQSGDVVIENIKEYSVIASPVKIEGKAKGNWFFEASFPVQIVDANWKVLGQGIAQAKADWMTTSLVPFDVNITFTKPVTKNGWLVFKKDNPSGLPKNDAEYNFPISF